MHPSRCILASIATLIPLLSAAPARTDEAVRDASGRVVQYVGDDGVIIDLVYEGDRVVRAEYNTGKVIVFVYDENGTPTGTYETHQ